MGNSCEEDCSKVKFFFKGKAYGRLVEAGSRMDGHKGLAMAKASITVETV